MAHEMFHDKAIPWIAASKSSDQKEMIILFVSFHLTSLTILIFWTKSVDKLSRSIIQVSILSQVT